MTVIRTSSELALLIALGAALVVPARLVANPLGVSDPRPISGASPFTPGCGRLDPAHPNYHSEVEPHLAVDPRDPSNLVAAWQQDRLPPGGGQSAFSAFSRDQGKTWKLVVVPGLTTCSGGSARMATDPWVSIGGDGRVYAASLTRREAVVPEGPNPATANDVVVNVSLDGGASWSQPSTVEGGPAAAADKESITADPRRSGRAYVVFRRGGRPGEPVGPSITGIVFSRTVDGGRTWSTALPVQGVTPPGAQHSPLLFVLPDGALVTLYSYEEEGDTPDEIRATRSEDGGKSWSQASVAARYPDRAVMDPEREEQTRTECDGVELLPCVFTAAAGPDGSIYVAWSERYSLSSSRLLIARSADGGKSWLAPRTSRTSQRNPSCQPSPWQRTGPSDCSITTSATTGSLTPH